MLTYGANFCRKLFEVLDAIIVLISFFLSIIFLRHQWLHFTQAIVLIRIWTVIKIFYGFYEAEYEIENIDELLVSETQIKSQS